MQRGQSGIKARESARELSSAAQRLQRFDGMDEREQGGPGWPEIGEERHGDTALCVGVKG